MNKYILILFAFIFTQYSCSVAQNTKDYPLTSNNKKALKYFYEAKEYYANHNDKLAELTFLQALEKDPNFIEPHIYLAYIYTDAGEYDKAIEHMGTYTVHSLCPSDATEFLVDRKTVI